MRLPLVAALLLAVARPLPALADPPSIEDRLRALEERVAQLESENAALRADVAPKPDAPAVAKAAGKERDLKVGGLLQVQAEIGGRGDARFSDGDDRVFLRRARLNVSGRFLEDLEWRTEIELAGSLADATALRGQLTDAYVAWKPKDALDLRAGQFKTPFGFEHLFSDPRLPLPERTLGSDRLTLSRQAGVQAGGLLAQKRFGWTIGAFNGTPANSSGNDDERFLVAARLSGTPLAWGTGRRAGKLTLGAGAYASEDAAIAMAPEFKLDSDPAAPGIDNLFRGDRLGTSADAQLAWGPVELWTEWISTRFRPSAGIPEDAFRARSRSAMASWLVTERLQVAARWDDFDPIGGRDGDATRTWTTGMAWLIRGQELKLQAAWMHVSGPPPDGLEDKGIVRFQLAF